MKEEEIRNICTAAAGLYGIIHVRQLLSFERRI